MKFKFKALTHGGWFIDIKMLSKGLYNTTIPTLYESYMTIDNLVEDYLRLFATYSQSNYPLGTREFIDNLKKCQLTEIELTVIQ